LPDCVRLARRCCEAAGPVPDKLVCGNHIGYFTTTAAKKQSNRQAGPVGPNRDLAGI